MFTIDHIRRDEQEVREHYEWLAEERRERFGEAREEDLKMKYCQLVGEAIDEVCEKLPDGWNVQIDLERGSGDVKLFSPDGDEIEFPANHEAFYQTIRDALEQAVYIETGEPA